jgi:hypothetical protein
MKINGANGWRLMLAVALMAGAGAASAQAFECVYANGNKEYARICPPGTVQQRQVLKSGDVAPGPPQKSINEQDAEFRKRQIEREEAAAKAAQESTAAAEAEGNCNTARGQLKALEDGQRISRIDPDTGERGFLGDEERVTETERARNAVEQWCKK